MLSHHIQNGTYSDVLRILADSEAIGLLKEAKGSAKVRELFRKFCPALMAAVPVQCVDVLLMPFQVPPSNPPHPQH